MSQDKVRIRKGVSPQKQQVLQSEDSSGNVSYVCPCDQCGKSERVPFEPKEDREFLCKECFKIAKKGKPSTVVVRHKDRTLYQTECDECATVEESSFLPMRDRPFLCNKCHKQNRPVREDKRPIKFGVKLIADSDPPVYEVPCDKCNTKARVGFAPRRGDKFFCPGCQTARMQARRKKKEGPRVFFNLECVVCGKKETIDFVPSNPAAALCRACFEKQQKGRFSS